ncbi:MAG: flagellar hook-length control protein FliK [Betaproteobacteria bacterium]|nr:flagellar hook-length control protein FliK [Betaproteobacteria bacterium]
MNTIPSVGPDTGIAPRSGSASPQTPSQQRADTAPTVLSDSPSAVADPGVLLKVTPPVQPRQGEPSVMGDAGGLPSTEALALALAKDVASPIESSGEQADLQIAKRISDAFAALPLDVQEAIKQASSPAIGQLLRLAAMTAPGIRDAPAHLISAAQPLAAEPGEAAAQLHENLRAAAPFQLARMLREVVLLGHGPEASEARAFLQQLSARRSGEAALTDSAGARQGPAGDELSRASGRVAQAASSGAAQGGMDAVLDVLFGPQTQSPSPSFQTIAARGAAAPNPDAGSPQPQRASAAQTGVPVGDTGLESVANISSSASSSLPASPTSPPSPAAPASGAPASATQASLAAPLNVLTPQQGEQAMRDGLKILMDGRMIWHGQFTPGVPMAMERSDAWRADRDSAGGMQKGTSLRFHLSLPQLGDLEIRAVGFGGQVSARVHAHPAVAGALARALPDLQTRLRENGLAGAQVAVEPH